MSASRQFNAASEALSQALLRIRSQVPKVEVTCPQSGVRHSVEFEPWQKFYYSHTAKNADLFRQTAPQAAVLIETEINSFLAALEAKNAEKAAEKAAKAERQANRATIKAERAAQPHRPLARYNPAAAENYGILSAIFSEQREKYAAQVVHDTLWAAGGKITANVNETKTRQAAFNNFDRYLSKLAQKITARILSGTLKGSLWVGSCLRVQTEAGEQRWETKCIFNQSSRGTLFHQWPTRLISSK